ncbi:MAG TPA: hypothetical protein VGD38_19105 [Pyrinomonadaceae bacterium]
MRLLLGPLLGQPGKTLAQPGSVAEAAERKALKYTEEVLRKENRFGVSLSTPLTDMGKTMQSLITRGMDLYNQ